MVIDPAPGPSYPPCDQPRRRPPLEILAHPDPFALEAELLDRLETLQMAEPMAPVLVLVPTVRLRDHLHRRLLDRRGAVLGVEVADYRALPHRILEGSSDPTPGPIHPLLLQQLLAGLLAAEPEESSLRRFVQERPGALGSLLATLQDLRLARIDPPALKETATSQGEVELAELYHRYHRGLTDLVRRGLCDEAGLVMAAVRELRRSDRFPAAYRAIFHHGAYELTEVRLELLRALDAHRPVRFLLPAEPDCRATRHAQEFAARHLGEDWEPVGSPDLDPAGLLGDRIWHLFQEEEQPVPSGEDRVSFQTAQGPAGEVRAALRSILAAVEAGTPPGQIALVARSLEPYGAHLTASLDEAGLPYRTSWRHPLRHRPEIRDLLTLIRAAAEGYPREPTVEVLSSRRIRWKALPDQPEPPAGDLADAWSRQAGLVEGLTGWTQDLPAWAGRTRHREAASPEELQAAEEAAAGRLLQAQGIARAVRGMDQLCRPSTDRTWLEHAEALREILRTIWDGEIGPEAEVRGALEEIIQVMAGQTTLLGDRSPVSLLQVAAWLEQAVGQARLRAGQGSAGGIQVLDAMQARGLTFRRLTLLGMNSGLFPRIVREDPFLRDEQRRMLIQRTRRALPVKGAGLAEERQILALLLGSTSDHLTVSWQRADASGRTLSPSLMLREVGRVLLGSADLDRVRRQAHPVPSHPLHELRDGRERSGLLSPSEELLLAALSGSGRGRTAEVLRGRRPDLGPGLAMLLATESFTPGSGAYDGLVGLRGRRSDRWSVTDLETLGRCPLQLFLRRILGVHELDEPASPLELAVQDLGSQVHRLLERVYRGLDQEDLFRTDRPELLVERGLELLTAEWEPCLGGADGPWREEAPILWESLGRSWLAALREFLRSDLGRIHREGWLPEGFEISARRDRPLPGGTVTIHGRFDRVLRTPEGLLVGDYKSAGKLEDRVKPAMMLKGRALQVPLYAWLAGPDTRVELLGVGPIFQDGTGEPTAELFTGFGKPDLAEGFQETLDELLGLLISGRFPLLPDHLGQTRHCAWCPVRAACRRTHPPTLVRMAQREDHRLLLDLRGKNTKQPTLALVQS